MKKIEKYYNYYIISIIEYLLSLNTTRMSAVRLIINLDVKCSAEYICNLFWEQNIAQINSITMLPYLSTTGMKNYAVIDVRHWCDTEIAYNFIQRLKVPEGEARLIHTDEQWWPVHMTTIENCHMNNNYHYYTTMFPKSYYEEDTSIEDALTTLLFEQALAKKDATLQEHSLACVI